jgi:hypothetical protein
MKSVGLRVTASFLQSPDSLLNIGANFIPITLPILRLHWLLPQYANLQRRSSTHLMDLMKSPLAQKSGTVTLSLGFS